MADACNGPLPVTAGYDGPERIWIGCSCAPDDPDCACEPRWSSTPFGSGREREFVRRDLDQGTGPRGATFWMEPACSPEREYCEEDVWGACDECGESSVPYVEVLPECGAVGETDDKQPLRCVLAAGHPDNTHVDRSGIWWPRNRHDDAPAPSPPPTSTPLREFEESSDGVHLMNGEYTLCGDAFDIGETEDDAPSLRPTGTRTVTCPRCVAIILLCRGVRVREESR